MARHEIVEALAKRRVVERIVEVVARKANKATRDDLAQTVYAIMLTYPAERIEGMNDRGELPFWIVAVTRNQYNDGPLARQLRTFSARSESLYNRAGEERFTDEG